MGVVGILAFLLAVYMLTKYWIPEHMLGPVTRKDLCIFHVTGYLKS